MTTWSLNGQIPQDSKDFVARSTEATLEYADQNNRVTWNCVIARPGFDICQLSQATAYAFFNGPKKPISNDCMRWLVWGGKLKRTTPLSLANSIAAKLKCHEWLSKINGTGVSLDDLTIFIKCCSYNRNKSKFIYPESDTSSKESSGDPSISSCFCFFLGKINAGGTNIPVAPMQGDSCHCLPSFRWYYFAYYLLTFLNFG